MNKHLISLALAAATTLVWSGCSGGGARRIDAGGRESVTTIGNVDIQDFVAAAEASVGKLLASGALDKVPNPPAILAISSVRNQTGQQFDTDLLTKKIRVKLNTSGKALTTTTVGLDGVAEDPLAKQLQGERELLEKKRDSVTPNFTLSGNGQGQVFDPDDLGPPIAPDGSGLHRWFHIVDSCALGACAQEVPCRVGAPQRMLAARFNARCRPGRGTSPPRSPRCPAAPLRARVHFA